MLDLNQQSATIYNNGGLTDMILKSRHSNLYSAIMVVSDGYDWIRFYIAKRMPVFQHTVWKGVCSFPRLL